MIIYCCGCENHIKAKLCTGKEIYPYRPDLYDKEFYKCIDCGNYVGVHSGTVKPLGCIPTPEIHRLRGLIHSILDPMWKSGMVKRSYLYENISKSIGFDFHTAKLKSVHGCRNVLNIIVDIKNQLTKVY